MRKRSSAFAGLLVFSVQGFDTNAFATDGPDSADTDVRSDTSLRAMEEIVVMSQRATKDLARQAQKEAENIVNVVSFEDIRKLPVVNSGDAVRMVPGVQLETDTGEGRFVNIRGLDSDLNSTTFGGVRLPATDVTTSPQGGSRAVSFDAIPAEMIGAVTVTKTNRPEQEAEALGGTIEITPKTVPMTGKPYFSDLMVGSGYEPLRGTWIKDFAATVGGRFGVKGSDYTPFSAIGVFSYYEDRRGVDDLEASYADNQAGGVPDKAQTAFDQRYYRQHKKRHVYGAELGYAPDTDNKWYIRYYDFGIVQDYNRNEFQWNPSGTPTVNPDGSLTDTATAQKDYRSTTETFDTRLFAAGGSNDLDKVKLDYFVAHTMGSYRQPFNYIPVWLNTATSTVAYNNTNSNFPSITVNGGANPLDPSGYAFSQLANNTQSSITKDWSGKINLAIPTHWTSYPTEELKFGVGARRRRFDQYQTQYTALAVPPIPLSQAEYGPNVSYYDNHYNMGPLIGTNVIANAFANGTGTGFSTDPVANAAIAARSTYNVREDVYAGYGQYQFGFSKLGIFTGLRVEATKSAFDAFAVSAVDTTHPVPMIQPVRSDHSYTDFLPSLQTRYEFSPTLVARAIYSSTIARPGYNQQSPSLNLILANNQASQGNPNIKPVHSHNIDLSIENYQPNGGIVSFGVFYKDLKDYIIPTITQSTFPNKGIFAGFTGPVHIITFANGTGARVRGYEVNAERRFTELPGWWAGFGASFNWTGVDSRVQERPGEFTALPSTARNTGNAALFYEKPGLFEVRLGANYTSRWLFFVGGSAATDQFVEPRTSVDLGSRLWVSEQFSLYFDAKNLTNTVLKFTEGRPDRPLQREFYRETYQLGVLANF